MGRACAGLLVVLVSSAACHVADTPTGSPDAQPVATSPTVADTPGDNEPTAAPAPPDNFTVTVSSQCPDAWHASLLRRDKEQPLSATDRFDATAEGRTLTLRHGDALVLTNDNGGIMAIDFDEVTPEQVARVEVAADCSGVNKTVSRAPADP